MRSALASILIALLIRGGDSLLGQAWTMTSAPITNWFAITASADGSTVAAVVNKNPYELDNGGPIYISTNGGASWNISSAPITNWIAIASSADGTRLIAAIAYPNPPNQGGSLIFLSTNSGGTWFASGAPTTNWVAVASSADGSVLAAAHAGVYRYAQYGRVYTSINGGADWQADSSPYLNWSSVASSADGSKLAAAGSNYSQVIFTSTNSGNSWAGTTAPNYEWLQIASSADGATLIAVAMSCPGVYLSTNSGATWNSLGVPSPYGCGWRIASSADGTTLAVSAYSIFLSTNSGASWVDTGAPSNFWASIAFSADGHKLIAAAKGGGIYVRQTTPTPSLRVNRSGNQIVLSWGIPSMKFVLQQTSDLSTTNWTSVLAMPAINYTNLHYQLSVPVSPGPVFYRLAPAATL